MHIKFTQNRFFLLDIDFSLDYDYQTVVAELEQEDWVAQGHTQVLGQENAMFNKRYQIKNQIPKSKILQEILAYLHSSGVHRAAVDSLYLFDPQFHGLWGMDKEKMLKFAFWHAYYQKDVPGFDLKLHTDYRRLVATGMIYLTEKDDANLSTYFYWDGKQENEVRLPTNFGNGWLHVNDAPNLHTGANKSQSDRYSILLGLTIRHPSDYGI